MVLHNFQSSQPPTIQMNGVTPQYRIKNSILVKHLKYFRSKKRVRFFFFFFLYLRSFLVFSFPPFLFLTTLFVVFCCSETKYFRFFVSQEHACRSIFIQPILHFGDAYVTVSNFLAYPNKTSKYLSENGQIFLASK